MPWSNHRYGVNYKPPLGGQIDPAHPLSASMVSYWVLNEAAGTALNDAGPGGNAMTTQPNPTNPLWTATGGDLSLAFNGSQYASSTFPGRVGGGDFTIFCSAMFTTLSGTQNLMRQDGGSPRAIILLRTVGDFHVRFELYDGSLFTVLSIETLVTGQFYQWVGTHVRSTGSMKLYLNGHLSAIGTGSTQNLETGAPVLFLGQSGSGSEYLSGAIQYAGLANQAWTADQVLAFYQSPYEMLRHGRVTRTSRAAAALIARQRRTKDGLRIGSRMPTWG